MDYKIKIYSTKFPFFAFPMKQCLLILSSNDFLGVERFHALMSMNNYYREFLCIAVCQALRLGSRMSLSLLFSGAEIVQLIL